MNNILCQVTPELIKKILTSENCNVKTDSLLNGYHAIYDKKNNDVFLGFVNVSKIYANPKGIELETSFKNPQSNSRYVSKHHFNIKNGMLDDDEIKNFDFFKYIPKETEKIKKLNEKVMFDTLQLCRKTFPSEKFKTDKKSKNQIEITTLYKEKELHIRLLLNKDTQRINYDFTFMVSENIKYKVNYNYENLKIKDFKGIKAEFDTALRISNVPNEKYPVLNYLKEFDDVFIEMSFDYLKYPTQTVVTMLQKESYDNPLGLNPKFTYSFYMVDGEIYSTFKYIEKYI